MCNKFTVLSLAYVVVFVAVVQCEDSSGLSGGVVNGNNTTLVTLIVSNFEAVVG